MSIPLNFYPKIDDKLIKKLGIGFDEFNFSYHASTEKTLKTKYPEDSTVKNIVLFEDPNYEWNPNRHNLKIKREVYLDNPQFLFGRNGVVNNDVVLALGVKWSSSSSNIRGAKTIFTFSSNNVEPIEQEIQLDIPSGVLKNELLMETIIFVYDVPSNKDDNVNNKIGLDLGTIDETKIIVEGDGSIFPIVEVEQPSMPLWWVDCSWTDPQDDLFDEENIKLCINRKHTNYPLVYDEKQATSPLFIEIVSSAIQIIITKVEQSEYWNQIKMGENNSPGSIGEVVYYFIETFNWDYSSPEILSRNIRHYLEKNM